MLEERCPDSWRTLLGGGCLSARSDTPETEAEYSRYLQLKMLEIQQRHLLPLKEDVTDWLNSTLGCDDITVDNFMCQLETGVRLCRLACVIVNRAAQMPPEEGKELISFTFKCWDKAAAGTFFARDNVYNFLQFCRALGCREIFLFETDGLVLHSQPRDVLLCLLELGRRTSRYVEPPCLVQFEHEIDQQLLAAAAAAAAAGRDGSSDSGYSDSHERQLTPPLLAEHVACEMRTRPRAAQPSPPPPVPPMLCSQIPVQLRRPSCQTFGNQKAAMGLNVSARCASVPASVLSTPYHHRSAFHLQLAGGGHASSPARRISAVSTPTDFRTPSRIPRLSQPPSGTVTPRANPGPLSRTSSVLGNDGLDGLSRRLREMTMQSTPTARQRRVSAASSVSSAARRSNYTPRTPLTKRGSARSMAATPSTPITNSKPNVSVLDEKIRQTVAEAVDCRKCRGGAGGDAGGDCQHVQLERLSEGQYVVAGKIVFIRLLKDRHVMVRVGGGWDTLEHFLTRHDTLHSSNTPATKATSIKSLQQKDYLTTPVGSKSATVHGADSCSRDMFLQLPSRVKQSHKPIAMDTD